MLAILQRSIENYSLWYVDFFRAGDRKSHNLLVSESVYGDIEVTKLECVGHVQKCMFSSRKISFDQSGEHFFWPFQRKFYWCKECFVYLEMVLCTVF